MLRRHSARLVPVAVGADEQQVLLSAVMTSLLLLDVQAMPVFRAFSIPDKTALTSVWSFEPADFRNHPKKASIGSEEIFLVRTKQKHITLRGYRMHSTFEMVVNRRPCYVSLVGKFLARLCHLISAG